MLALSNRGGGGVAYVTRYACVFEMRMTKKQKQEQHQKLHDDCVLNTGTALATLGKVSVDLPSEYATRHAFDPKEVLPKEPPLMLAGLLPTQAVFTTFGVLLNEHWKEPDLVLARDGYRYVVDVHNDNDTFNSVARKIESIIFCAKEWNVVGLAMVAYAGSPPKCRDKLTELESLRKTFWQVIGVERFGDPESAVTYMNALTQLPKVAALYGKPDWSRVVELDATAPGWEERLRVHAEHALDSRHVMMTTTPSRP